MVYCFCLQTQRGVILSMRILYVDCCLRGSASRTKKLAEAFLKECNQLRPEAEITTVELDRLLPSPTDSRTLALRDILTEKWEDPFFAPSRTFLDADLIVLAAPFWNGSYPALLHAYLESVCVPGLTFTCEGETYTGKCRASACVLITTRGGCYEHGSMLGPEHATPLITSIMKMLGVHRVETLAAEGLDLVDNPAPILDEACIRATRLAKMLLQ